MKLLPFLITALVLPFLVFSQEAEPNDAELEAITEWFHEQSWMIALCSDLPKGISISAQTFRDEEPDWYLVEVREFHTAESGYDPNVSPMVGMFRVSEDRSKILYMDVVAGEFVSVRKFIEDRNLW
ncbi:MAG: hypothetical protein CMO55_17315 [Verrucomicrobiales bacterium]|nr:hypothetical protein [Verrucomicrobiales bacterium]